MSVNTRKWGNAAPETLGFSRSKLDVYLHSLASNASGKPHGTVIVRHGKIAAEYYGDGADRWSLWEIGSIRKAVGCTLLGMAIEAKKMALDTVVYDVWPEIYQETGQEKDKEIRVRHLFNSTSGWKRTERAGTRWAYNNAAFTAGGMVLGRIYGCQGDKIAHLVKKEIADIIGAESWRCYHYPNTFTTSASNPGPKLAIDSNLRDLAKFGYLWLNSGEWNGKQIVPESHVKEATRNQVAHLKAHYGFCWFTNDSKILLPAAPEDTYFHIGNGAAHRRTVLMVIPSLALVAAVGTDATKYDITADYTAQPVPRVNEWASQVLRSLEGG